MEQNVKNKQNKKLIVGLIFNWLIIAFVSLFVLLFLKGLVSIVGSQPWFYDILEKQFVTVIGLPLSALASLCLVILLEVRSGSMEFEGFGFKFKGASAPIIFWVICFMAIVTAIKLLWIS